MQKVVGHVRVLLILLFLFGESAFCAPNRATDEAVIGSGLTGIHRSGKNALNGIDKVKDRLNNGNTPFNNAGQSTVVVRVRPRNLGGGLRAVSKYSNPCNSRRIKRALAACPTCSCSPNYEVKASVTPNDTSYGNLWGMPFINAPTAWDTTTGSDSVVIGVIDTGVDYNHPDLVDNMWVNPSEIAANGIDDDGNGYIDDIYGINAITNSGNPLDDHNHGTHCAGTIAGRGNNNLGVAGVAWRTKIIGAKFLNSSGSGLISDAIQSLDYLNDLKVNYGVNVVATSNSWGGGGFSQPLLDEITRSRNAGVLFIAAAGNDATDLDGTNYYPATYGVDNMIVVAALSNTGALAGFSNHGTTQVHIGAPGVGIYSTIRNNGYGSMSGTSMATPHVSGVVALLAAAFPASTMADRRNAILNGARIDTNLSIYIINSRVLEANESLGELGVIATPTPTSTPTIEPTKTPTPIPTPVSTSTPTPVPTPEPSPTEEPEVLDIVISPTALRSGRTFTVTLGGAKEAKNVTVALGTRSCGSISMEPDTSVSGRLPKRLTRRMNRLGISTVDELGATVKSARFISGARALGVSYKKACGYLLGSLRAR